MAYLLEAVISSVSCIKSIVLKEAVAVQLAHGFAMLPMTDTLLAAIHGRPLSQDLETLGRFNKLTPELMNWLKTLSQTGRIAYVEAESAGGPVYQSALVLDKGEIILPAIHREDAINHALHSLGVPSYPPRKSNSLEAQFGSDFQKGEKDEFDELGLGQHRSTDDWVEKSTE